MVSMRDNSTIVLWLRQLRGLSVMALSLMNLLCVITALQVASAVSHENGTLTHVMSQQELQNFSVNGTISIGTHLELIRSLSDQERMNISAVMILVPEIKLTPDRNSTGYNAVNVTQQLIQGVEKSNTGANISVQYDVGDILAAFKSEYELAIDRGEVELAPLVYGIVAVASAAATFYSGYSAVVSCKNWFNHQPTAADCIMNIIATIAGIFGGMTSYAQYKQSGTLLTWSAASNAPHASVTLDGITLTEAAFEEVELSLLYNAFGSVTKRSYDVVTNTGEVAGVDSYDEDIVDEGWITVTSWCDTHIDAFEKLRAVGRDTLFWSTVNAIRTGALNDAFGSMTLLQMAFAAGGDPYDNIRTTSVFTPSSGSAQWDLFTRSDPCKNGVTVSVPESGCGTGNPIKECN